MSYLATVDGRYGDRLSKSTLKYSNAYRCFDCIIVAFMREFQLYIHDEHYMGEVIVRYTIKLRVRYVSCFKVDFRKKFTRRNAVGSITRGFKIGFDPFADTPCSATERQNSSLQQASEPVGGFVYRLQREQKQSSQH